MQTPEHFFANFKLKLVSIQSFFEKKINQIFNSDPSELNQTHFLIYKISYKKPNWEN